MVWQMVVPGHEAQVVHAPPAFHQSNNILQRSGMLSQSHASMSAQGPDQQYSANQKGTMRIAATLMTIATTLDLRTAGITAPSVPAHGLAAAHVWL